MGMKRVELYNLSCRCNEAFWVENSVGVHYSPCLRYIVKKSVGGYTLSYQYSGGNNQCRGTLFLTADTDPGTNSSGISESAVALSI